MIGKERVFLAIAEEFDYKIWATSDKKRILRALENDNILKRMSDSPNNANIFPFGLQCFVRTHLHSTD